VLTFFSLETIKKREKGQRWTAPFYCQKRSCPPPSASPKGEGEAWGFVEKGGGKKKGAGETVSISFSSDREGK